MLFWKSGHALGLGESLFLLFQNKSRIGSYFIVLKPGRAAPGAVRWRAHRYTSFVGGTI